MLTALLMSVVSLTASDHGHGRNTMAMVIRMAMLRGHGGQGGRVVISLTSREWVYRCEEAERHKR